MKSMTFWHAMGTSSVLRRHRDLERHCRTARETPTVMNTATANLQPAVETLARFLQQTGFANIISKKCRHWDIWESARFRAHIPATFGGNIVGFRSRKGSRRSCAL